MSLAAEIAEDDGPPAADGAPAAAGAAPSGAAAAGAGRAGGGVGGAGGGGESDEQPKGPDAGPVERPEVKTVAIIHEATQMSSAEIAAAQAPIEDADAGPSNDHVQVECYVHIA